MARKTSIQTGAYLMDSAKIALVNFLSRQFARSNSRKATLIVLERLVGTAIKSCANIGWFVWDERREGMKEAIRIIHCAARMPMFHGSTTANVVDEILASCGGQIICNGHLREFVFTKITENSFTFKTEDWHKKTYGRHT